MSSRRGSPCCTVRCAARMHNSRARPGVRPVINSLHQARLWLDAGGGPCDLMVDTGINRLGLPPARDRRSAGRRARDRHAACRTSPRPTRTCAQNARQLALFEEIARAACRRGARSLANSAGIALGAALRVRPDPPGPRALRRRAAARAGAARSARSPIPQAAVLQLRDLSPGDSVGYNATFTADRPMRAATVSLGYADGFLRCWAGAGALRHGEARAAAARPRVDGHGGGRSAPRRPDLREGDWLDRAVQPARGRRRAAGCRNTSC